jgi:hypothetical protein
VAFLVEQCRVHLSGLAARSPAALPD